MNDFNEQAFAQAFAVAYKAASNGLATGTKFPATTVGANWIHGPGGLFGAAGLDSQVISGRVAPRGISSVLKAFPSVYTNPLYPYITGIEELGDEPTVECETCPHSETEACWQTAVFGFVCRETKTLTPNRAIERIREGEIDLVLVNDILGFQPGELFAAIQSYDMNTVLQVATAWAMLDLAAIMQNALIPMVWQGNPANNIGTGYAEFPGLGMLVSRNKVDARTGTACDALYSDVKNFNYQLVNTVSAQGIFAITRQLSYLDAYLYHNADRMGFLPVEWVYVMRPELWYELSDIWPIAYWSTRNTNLPDNRLLNLDAARVSDVVDQMRSGMYIYINGRRHTVIADDGIFESNSANDANIPAGSFASTIYAIPLTVRGGTNVTYFQHKDYKQAQPEIDLARLQDEIWTDDGRFLWTVDRIKWCYTLSAKIEPRIILKTPQLAGRLDHVMYAPEQHFRSPFQDDDYFFKGGVDRRQVETLYSEWNLPT